MAQHFFIKKGSTLPILKMKVINDGRFDYKEIFQKLENAAITFCMRDEKGKFKVFNQQALLFPIERDDCCDEDQEYYIGYKFKPKEVNTVGCYNAEFKIDFFDDGCTLIVPIREKLVVNVVDSCFTQTNIVC